MLLPWNKPARLAVGAQQVIAWVTPPDKPAIRVSVPLLDESDAEAAGDAHSNTDERHRGLSAAIRSAIVQLSAKSSRSIRSLDVEIGDHYAFYEVVETDARGATEEQLRKLAALAIADSYGMDAGALVARCSVQRDGRSMVACAVHRDLLETVKSAVAAAERKTGKLEPAFGAFLDRHRSLFRDGHALIARQTESFLMLGLLDAGRWRAFSAEHLADAGWLALRDGCDAFCRRAGVADPDSLPVWFEAEADDMPDEAGERWHRLPSALSFA